MFLLSLQDVSDLRHIKEKEEEEEERQCEEVKVSSAITRLYRQPAPPGSLMWQRLISTSLGADSSQRLCCRRCCRLIILQLCLIQSTRVGSCCRARTAPPRQLRPVTRRRVSGSVTLTEWQQLLLTFRSCDPLTGPHVGRCVCLCVCWRPAKPLPPPLRD